MITREQLQALQTAVVATDLCEPQRRRMLLVGLDQRRINALPVKDRPGDQIISDLNELYSDVFALAAWLRNARLLVITPPIPLLDELLAVLEHPPAGPSALRAADRRHPPLALGPRRPPHRGRACPARHAGTLPLVAITSAAATPPTRSLASTPCSAPPTAWPASTSSWTSPATPSPSAARTPPAPCASTAAASPAARPPAGRACWKVAAWSSSWGGTADVPLPALPHPHRRRPVHRGPPPDGAHPGPG
ncbi:MAG: hypothetical protein R3F43_08475 [bacterium]